MNLTYNNIANRQDYIHFGHVNMAYRQGMVRFQYANIANKQNGLKIDSIKYL